MGVKLSGAHSGNVGVVDTRSGNLTQVLAINRPIPGCELEADPDTGEIPVPEPNVHGVNVQTGAGTAYVGDEGEDCFYESVTILQP
ncbi:MAG: hypothetical protein ACM3ST_03400 [Bdellovibrio bacteriovorus]